ncbi:MAG: hypothetical protein M3N21_02225 [Actinomycetota bacterium]|nr:hypothetical protein [Actinomycetota bacterium]
MIRRGMGGLRAATAVGAVVVLAGCGSTVAQTAGTSARSLGAVTDQNGLAAPGASVGSAVTAGAGSPGTTNGGSSAGTATSGNQGTAVAPGAGLGPGPASGGGGAPTGALQGLGVTATSISVGIPYFTNGDAYNAAAGAAVKNGDPRADWQAVVEDINAHGGITGRKLVAVFHAYDANSTQPGATQDQAACSDFTQDHRVFAVLGRSTDVLDACLQNAGVIHLDAGSIIGPDKKTFEPLPLYFNSTLSQERMMADEVGVFRRTGYFSAWDYGTGKPGALPVKLGILSLDTPQWERPLESTLLPALARAGHPVAGTDVVRVHSPKSQAEIAQSVNDVQGAVLKFRTDGVTHLILLDANGSLTLLFAKPAQGQRYFPRLGINSASGVQALADQGVIGNDQLGGAIGLGWIPSVDLPAAASPKYATNASRRCLKVMKTYTGNDYTSTAAATAFGICDMGNLFSAGVRGAGSRITSTSVRTALESLGTGFAAAALPEEFYGPARHDGTQRGFDLQWSTDCTCALYAGAHEIP